MANMESSTAGTDACVDTHMAFRLVADFERKVLTGSSTLTFKTNVDGASHLVSRAMLRSAAQQSRRLAHCPPPPSPSTPL